MSEYYSHSKEGMPQSEWQLLRDHLNNTAEIAGSFAAVIGAENWGRYCGLLHDLGKYAASFQQMLKDGEDNRTAGERDHSSAGAQYHKDQFGVLCAFAVAGHHSGLLDWVNGTHNSLQERLKKDVSPWQCEEAEQILKELPSVNCFPQPLLAKIESLMKSPNRTREIGWEIALFVRMIYSCLVDADFLDTESFFSPETAISRPIWPMDIMGKMDKLLESYLERMTSESEIGRIRRQILQECRQASALAPGFFTLTVPTGGGKTLSSLAFALKHALRYHKKRIVYVVPYISIIEQNAEVFKKVFASIAPNPVLEVHSNLEYSQDKGDNSRQLAAENFDAPLVVTTAVQFFESFFADRSSRCRKLHNLADAVIIFDEVQKVPEKYLFPIMHLWRSLVEVYHSSLILCTATQPELWQNEYLKNGLPEKERREIISDPETLYQKMKRVNIALIGEISDDELAKQIQQAPQVLCIVNTISHAVELYKKLPADDSCFCLTTRIFPEHRSTMLAQISGLLKAGSICKVIATSLVEAGVDLDFPLVYRSLCGIDSIAQAAGRCNREGKIPSGGKVQVFISQHQERESFLKREKTYAKEVSYLTNDLLSRQAVRDYFQRLFLNAQLDEDDILGDFCTDCKTFMFQYSKVGERFHMIDDDVVGVVVPCGEALELTEKMRYAPVPDYRIVRRLQRYAVNLPRKLVEIHLAAGDIQSMCGGALLVLTSPEAHYDEKCGITFEGKCDGVFI